MRRPRRGRKPVGKHLSISATDEAWDVVSRNAARLGLSKARYLVGLVKRDASEEEDRGPSMALTPEEQRELLAALREIRALILEDTRAPAEEASPPAVTGERDIAASAPAGGCRRGGPSGRGGARPLAPAPSAVRGRWSPRSARSSPPPRRCRTSRRTGTTRRTTRSTAMRASGTGGRRRSSA